MSDRFSLVDEVGTTGGEGGGERWCVEMVEVVSGPMEFLGEVS